MIQPPRSDRFGQWLREQRRELGLTQEELADKVGCSRALIRKIEAGERTPSLQVAELLASCIQIPAQDQAEFVKFARGTSSAFPTERTILGSAHTNLPAPLTPILGRDLELEELRHLLGHTERLVTLVGPPGIGKTRLAIEAARQAAGRFTHGVYFVDLASVTHPNGVVSTIASTLGVEAGSGPLLASVIRYLRGKSALLVIDNFEQVVSAAADVAELLQAVTTISSLVTSREVLRVRGERQFDVRALHLPDPEHIRDLELLSANPSVALFVRSAQLALPRFEVTDDNADAIARICARLDGLPLAIELAAARIKLFSPHEMSARLDSSLKLLTDGARDMPERQRTLRRALEWSHNLLEPDEKVLFRRLGVFRGGCSLQSAEAVCNAKCDLRVGVAEGLASLLDKSLLRQHEGAVEERRFTMLETVREYAAEHLEGSQEAEEIGLYHAEYFLALAEAAEPQLRGPQQPILLDRLGREHSNLRASLEWGLREASTPQALLIGLRLVGALGWFWELRGHLVEGRSWAQLAIERGEVYGHTAVLARVLNVAGRLLWRQGDNASAHPFFERSLAIFKEEGDQEGIANSLSNLGLIANGRREYRQARSLHEQSLALRREIGDAWGVALSLGNLGLVAFRQGEYERAEQLHRQSLVLRRELGDTWGTALSLDSLAAVLGAKGNYEMARSLQEESLSIRRTLGHKQGIAQSLHGLGSIALQEGNYGRAEMLFLEALDTYFELEDTGSIALSFVGLGTAAFHVGDYERAVHLFGAAQTVFASGGTSISAYGNARYESYLQRARAELGEATYEALWTKAQETELEQAATLRAIIDPPKRSQSATE
jgi:predicted ATPase/DNA-binding XRE family transcriptional regulator